MPMNEYLMAQLPIKHLISKLYIPDSDDGYISELLRNSGMRRATVTAGNNYEEYISVVDIVAAAGFKLAVSNWKNIMRCYFEPPIIARSWADIRDSAGKSFLMPSIRATESMHGKTAVVPFKQAVEILSRLPNTKEATIADIQRIYKKQADILRHFEMPPTGSA